MRSRLRLKNRAGKPLPYRLPCHLMEQHRSLEDLHGDFPDDAFQAFGVAANIVGPIPIGQHLDHTTFMFDPTQPLEHIWDGEWEGTLEWSIIEGRLECTGIQLRHINRGRSITTSLLRKFRLGSQIDRWRNQRKAESEVWRELGTDHAISDEARRHAIRLRKALSRHRYEPEHFEEVAKVYDTAYSRGDFPTRAVQIHFSQKHGHEYSRSAAAKWVMECRRIGLLPATTQRTAAGNTTQQEES